MRRVVVELFPLSQQIERNFKFTDVGGIQPMRLLWREYVKEGKVDVVMFMVDASDAERIQSAQIELARVIQMVDASVPVLVVGSKFDVHRAQSAYQLCKMMKLPQLLGPVQLAPASPVVSFVSFLSSFFFLFFLFILVPPVV